MKLLIDGYNLLHASNIFAGEGEGTELHRSRLALLNFMAKAMKKRERAETTIVFDAAGAPPGLPHNLTHDGITVRFARRQSSADELIEDLIEECKSPKSLTVVSGDHRVQRAARRRGAKFVDSDTWYADARSAQRAIKSKGLLAEAKPSGELSPEQLAYWISKFDDQTPSQSDDGNSFPPGYGEDLLDDG